MESLNDFLALVIFRVGCWFVGCKFRVGYRFVSLNLKIGGLGFGWGYWCFIKEYRFIKIPQNLMGGASDGGRWRWMAVVGCSRGGGRRMAASGDGLVERICG